MQRTTLNLTGGILLPVLLTLFGVLLWEQRPQASATIQLPVPAVAAPAAATDAVACATTTKQGVTFDFDGYRHDGAGATALTLAVTNANRLALDAILFTSSGWTRQSPADRGSYQGALGAYRVTWLLHNISRQEAFHFQPQGNWFRNGAQEHFTVQVTNFDPTRPLTAWVRANLRWVEVQVRPSAHDCDRTPPTPTPTATSLPFSPLPTPTPTPEGGVVLPTEPVVAACVFGPPAGGIPPDEPIVPLSAYSFSEPQLVLTNTAPIWIEQWLPDSETLMVTRRESMDDHLYSIDLINSTTSETTQIVEPHLHLKDPKWIATNQSVIWRETSSPDGHKAGYWIRSLDPAGQRRLSQNATGGSIAHDVSSDGKQVAFMSLPGGTQPLIWHQESRTLSALPADLNNWRYQNGPSYPLRPFNVNWQPSSDNILFWDGTWAFLYNLSTSSGCELNMQDFAGFFDSFVRAEWSPNGRYLSAQLTLDPPYTTNNGPYGLIWILDTYTGESVQYNLDQTVANFTWAADNQTVAFSGPTGEKSGDFDQHGIYLLNVHNGEVRRIPTVENLSISNPQWSPDGTRLAFHCHDYSGGFHFDDYRVCTSHVTLSQ